ncbi:MAG: TlpA family protein disulfide reductase [Planctomycetes bacterium]|nr:TlpA family protein disulfide reductase [Planctomycetota bacterium]
MKNRFALTAAALLAVATFAIAQDVPAGPGANDAPVAPPVAPAKPVEKDAVRKAWDDMKALQDTMKAAAAAKDMAAMQTARTEYMAKQQEFKAAFAKADWEKIDPKAEMDLLGTGLQMLMNDALGKGDGASGVKLCETFLAKLPDSPAAKSVGGRMLPMAHLMAGQLPKAVAIWEKNAADADPAVKCDGLLNLGDVKAAEGDVAAAKAFWQQIADMPAGANPRDAVNQLKPYADLRLTLVGNPAPEIDSKTWLDGEAKPLSAHKGSVVVVDFWATWCPPCRGVMPALNEMFEAKKKDGLVVLGVTHFYPSGFMPKAGTKEPVSDGEKVSNLTEAQFPDHLKQFKTNLAITYPFVTATDAEFKAYKVSGIPTMAVIDRQGKVAFVKVGGGDETMLKIVVDRLLAAK